MWEAEKDSDGAAAERPEITPSWRDFQKQILELFNAFLVTKWCFVTFSI